MKEPVFSCPSSSCHKSEADAVGAGYLNSCLAYLRRAVAVVVEVGVLSVRRWK